jgi:hypothetical protein
MCIRLNWLLIGNYCSNISIKEIESAVSASKMLWHSILVALETTVMALLDVFKWKLPFPV